MEELRNKKLLFLWNPECQSGERTRNFKKLRIMTKYAFTSKLDDYIKCHIYVKYHNYKQLINESQAELRFQGIACWLNAGQASTTPAQHLINTVHNTYKVKPEKIACLYRFDCKVEVVSWCRQEPVLLTWLSLPSFGLRLIRWSHSKHFDRPFRGSSVVWLRCSLPLEAGWQCCQWCRTHETFPAAHPLMEIRWTF